MPVFLGFGTADFPINEINFVKEKNYGDHICFAFVVV